MGFTTNSSCWSTGRLAANCDSSAEECKGDHSSSYSREVVSSRKTLHDKEVYISISFYVTQHLPVYFVIVPLTAAALIKKRRRSSYDQYSYVREKKKKRPTVCTARSAIKRRILCCIYACISRRCMHLKEAWVVGLGITGATWIAYKERVDGAVLNRG